MFHKHSQIAINNTFKWKGNRPNYLTNLIHSQRLRKCCCQHRLCLHSLSSPSRRNPEGQAPSRAPGCGPAPCGQRRRSVPAAAAQQWSSCRRPSDARAQSPLPGPTHAGGNTRRRPLGLVGILEGEAEAGRREERKIGTREKQKRSRPLGLVGPSGYKERSFLYQIKFFLKFTHELHAMVKWHKIQAQAHNLP